MRSYIRSLPSIWCKKNNNTRFPKNDSNDQLNWTLRGVHGKVLYEFYSDPVTLYISILPSPSASHGFSIRQSRSLHPNVMSTSCCQRMGVARGQPWSLQWAVAREKRKSSSSKLTWPCHPWKQSAASTFPNLLHGPFLHLPIALPLAAVTPPLPNLSHAPARDTVHSGIQFTELTFIYLPVGFYFNIC